MHRSRFGEIVAIFENSSISGSRTTVRLDGLRTKIVSFGRVAWKLNCQVELGAELAAFGHQAWYLYHI